jgi:FixJ family two-component response regulator
MNSDEPIVFVVDDDYRVREALSSLIASVGLRVVAFGEIRDNHGVLSRFSPVYTKPQLGMQLASK